MSTDFSTIDRLVEFGMGTALAHQMINTMNQAMTGAMTPGNGVRQLDEPGQHIGYYVAVDGMQAGPLTKQELSILIERGKVNRRTLVWHKGLAGWVMAAELPDVCKLLIMN